MTTPPSGPPPAIGVRPHWADLPRAVRAAIEEGLGSPVVAAVTQSGGFSPGPAARVTLADGRRAFVKAIDGRVNDHGAAMHRREAGNTAAMPPGTPVPRLLGHVEHDGWVALLLEDVPGRLPHQPWHPAELRRVLDAYDTLTATLDPSPVAVSAIADDDPDLFSGFGQLAEAGAGPAEVGRWAARHVDQLAALEADWPTAAAGTALIHGDLRADNVLIADDGRVVFVDWPAAQIGARWFDVVATAGSLLMHNGPGLIPFLEERVARLDADPERITTVLAAATGYFLHRATQPAPPGLPTLRAFQRAQGRAALVWLRSRLSTR